jgi:threonine synthase
LKYLSTRGGAEPRNFSDILLEGLMPDGGLAVPETVPRFMKVKLDSLRNLAYPQLAFEIIRLYADDIPGQDLKAILEKTYTKDVFGSEDITPVKPLGDGIALLCCSNGPTLAFKDIAMQFLGHLFEYVLAKQGRSINILGATSGDTGSSAEYAMKGRANIRVFMLSPNGRMSPFQQAQMYSLDEPNIFNIAIRGVFDDCQDIVKAVSNDARFKSEYRIGAVNSINWGRIVAQVVYYFKGYFALTQDNTQEIDVVVPSGNFGNIYAGYLAKRMGLPIRRLILATNENDVLHEFFESGRYRPRKSEETHATSSPSMDISKASNFERFIWHVAGGNQENGATKAGARVAALWREMEHFGGFDISQDDEWSEVRDSGFLSGSSSHSARVFNIRSVFEKYGVVIDPHTADGVCVARQTRDEDDNTPMLCIETALPAKFEATVQEALGRPPERPAGFEDIEQLPQSYTVLDADAGEVMAFIRDHVPA